MSIKSFFMFMSLAGLLLGSYTLGLHEYFLSADDGQIRLSCKRLCTLELSGAGASDGILGKLTKSVSGSACSMAADSPLLDECHESAAALGMTVADFRCVAGAADLTDARECGDRIPK